MRIAYISFAVIGVVRLPVKSHASQNRAGLDAASSEDGPTFALIANTGAGLRGEVLVNVGGVIR